MSHPHALPLMMLLPLLAVAGTPAPDDPSELEARIARYAPTELTGDPTSLSGTDRSRTYDIPMREQLASGQVVLIATLAQNDQGDYQFLLPISDYLFSLPGGPMDVGLVNFYTDKDGMVRRFSPTFFDDGTIPNLTFATLLAVRAAGLEPTSETWSLGRWKVPNRVHPYPIGFVGPPGTIPRLSFSRLLNPLPESDQEIQRLKDKVVIIAAEHVGHQDIHLTPYAHGFLGFEGRLMSGAEVHANIVETLFSGRFPQSVPNGLRLIYLAGGAHDWDSNIFQMAPPAGVRDGFSMNSRVASFLN